MITVKNHKGRQFAVRVVLQGECYGLEDCLKHDKNDPLVEFYDYTYKDKGEFGERGQFCSRYHLSTLIEGDAGYELRLYNDVPEWTLTPENKLKAVQYALRKYIDNLYSSKETLCL